MSHRGIRAFLVGDAHIRLWARNLLFFADYTFIFRTVVKVFSIVFEGDPFSDLPPVFLVEMFYSAWHLPAFGSSRESAVAEITAVVLLSFHITNP